MYVSYVLPVVLPLAVAAADEQRYPIDRTGWLTDTRPTEIYLGDRIEAHPIIATEKHWIDVHVSLDGPTSLTAASRFPIVKTIPKYAEYCAGKMLGIRPTVGSRGGGFFPVLVKLADGTLACVFRTGQVHVGNGGQLSLSLSPDRGRTWTPYTVVVSGNNDEDFRDPAFGQAINGDLVLVFGVYEKYGRDGKPIPGKPGGWSRLICMRSGDLGATWTRPGEIELPEPVVKLRPGPHGQMRSLADGTLAFNIRGGRPRQSFLVWSRDNGVTWPEVTLVGDHTEFEFLPLSEKRWMGFARDDRGPRIRHSRDGGRTWRDSLQMRGGGQIEPGHPVDLGNGRLAVVFGCRAFPFGVRAILSRDGGRTFDPGTQYVLCDSFFHIDCGYPSSVTYDDGTIVTAAYCTYDWKHPKWGTCAIAFVYNRSVFGKQNGEARK